MFIVRTFSLPGSAPGTRGVSEMSKRGQAKFLTNDDSGFSDIILLLAVVPGTWPISNPRASLGAEDSPLNTGGRHVVSPTGGRQHPPPRQTPHTWAIRPSATVCSAFINRKRNPESSIVDSTR